MSFTVYILFSESFKKHYTDYTVNLESRLDAHNAFGQKCNTRLMHRLKGN
ncbi:MAG: GIY-YIG nuclease family protein [Chitinophagaceae bacterium]